MTEDAKVQIARADALAMRMILKQSLTAPARDESPADIAAAWELLARIDHALGITPPQIKPTHESARPCGCDPGASYQCEEHRR